MGQLTPLVLRPDCGLDGFRWAIFPLPARYPYHIDVLLDPSNHVLGWTRTKRKNSVTEALAMPETYAGERISLQLDGQFIGVGATRTAAADMVCDFVKKTRLP